MTLHASARRYLLASLAALAVCVGADLGTGEAATQATDCFTITVTNTPLQPPPGATVCSPIDVPHG